MFSGKVDHSLSLLPASPLISYKTSSPASLPRALLSCERLMTWSRVTHGGDPWSYLHQSATIAGALGSPPQQVRGQWGPSCKHQDSLTGWVPWGHGCDRKELWGRGQQPRGRESQHSGGLLTAELCLLSAQRCCECPCNHPGNPAQDQLWTASWPGGLCVCRVVGCPLEARWAGRAWSLCESLWALTPGSLGKLAPSVAWDRERSADASCSLLRQVCLLRLVI